MTDQTSEHMSAPDLETMDSHSGLTRRRLLKGAATVAPVILTLRSGTAQAAISACTAEPNRTSTSTEIKVKTSTGDCESVYGDAISSDESCKSYSPDPSPYYNSEVSVMKNYCDTGGQFKFCPADNAIYSANAVFSVRCPDL